MPYLDPDDVIEASRKERLKELAGRRAGKTDLASARQAASALMKAVDDELAGSPVIATDPNLYRLAYRAFESLFELHRAMSARNL